MKICYFADGRLVHIKRWAKYFADRGHEMHLISFKPMSEQDHAEMQNIGVKVLGEVGLFHVKKFWLTFGDLLKVRRVLKQANIDVLHSHFLGTNTWFAALSLFRPHVITVMGGDIKGKDWKPDDNRQERILTPLALKKADEVTVWSKNLAGVVARYRKKKSPVIHGGVNLEKFSPGERSAQLLEKLNIPAHASVIFSPRLLRRLYKIDEIARAAGKICEKLPDTYFVIALPALDLDTEYFEEIKEIFASGAARDRVRYVTSISHDEIADYYRLASVTVCIPITDGTPMSVLESMACGTPTVIGNLSDYDPDYFENEKTTLMVNVHSSDKIAGVILRLLEDRALSSRLAEEARRRVLADASVEAQMSKMEEIYNKLTGNSKLQPIEN